MHIKLAARHHCITVNHLRHLNGFQEPHMTFEKANVCLKAMKVNGSSIPSRDEEDRPQTVVSAQVTHSSPYSFRNTISRWVRKSFGRARNKVLKPKCPLITPILLPDHRVLRTECKGDFSFKSSAAAVFAAQSHFHPSHPSLAMDLIQSMNMWLTNWSCLCLGSSTGAY